MSFSSSVHKEFMDYNMEKTCFNIENEVNHSQDTTPSLRDCSSQGNRIIVVVSLVCYRLTVQIKSLL